MEDTALQQELDLTIWLLLECRCLSTIGFDGFCWGHLDKYRDARLAGLVLSRNARKVLNKCIVSVLTNWESHFWFCL